MPRQFWMKSKLEAQSWSARVPKQMVCLLPSKIADPWIATLAGQSKKLSAVADISHVKKQRGGKKRTANEKWQLSTWWNLKTRDGRKIAQRVGD